MTFPVPGLNGLPVILNDLLNGQDIFTKSGGHVRSLRPEV